MKPISGIDANFLYLETPTLHMHTIKVALLDPGGTAPSFDAIRRGLEARLDRLPPFRQRVAWVPFGLTHPFWVDDPDFDLRFHLARRRAPAPGGHHELCAVVSEIAGLPLDPRRPLWELTVVEGLEAGRVAFVAKLHHAIADGARAVELLQAALGEDVPAQPLPEPAPARRTLLARGMRAVWLRLAGLPSLLLATLRGLLHLLQRTADPGSTRLPLPAPTTSFNRALGAERSFAVASLPLEPLRRIKRQHGVTLNDALMAVCAGAVRSYLIERGESVERPLVVGVPTNVRREGGPSEGGNHVGHLIAPLRTDIADPVARMHAIHVEMAEAKARDAALGARLMERWAEFTPPGLARLVARSWSRWRIGGRVPPPINLVISNVPGPPGPIGIQGARLEALYSVGPILEGIGLNLTGWSYAGRLAVAALGCPESLPDPWKLVDRLPEALAELEALSREGPPAPTAELHRRIA